MAEHKTYVPTLLFWLTFGHKYATRWQAKLNANLSSECQTKLADWIAATIALIICIGSPTVGP